MVRASLFGSLFFFRNPGAWIALLAGNARSMLHSIV
jgi:hypothetical protein